MKKGRAWVLVLLCESRFIALRDDVAKPTSMNFLPRASDERMMGALDIIVRICCGSRGSWEKS
ncbi:hypothetical protein [Rhizobium leguminosarum]|uniref:hypothetical protein n=1 Tax=Rhizobium leguminosarum TaxID=384 RepID=UPI003D70113A